MSTTEIFDPPPDRISQVMRARWCLRAGKFGADGHTTGRIAAVVDEYAPELYAIEDEVRPKGFRIICNPPINREVCENYWEGVSQMRLIFERKKTSFQIEQWSKIVNVFNSYFSTGYDIQEPVIEYRHESSLPPQATNS